MLINVAQEEECRIAVVENGQLEELYIERINDGSHVGNIYKGRVVNVEPSIQACFIDFGIGKNGFLHISDLQSSYFQEKTVEKERVGKKRPRRDRPPIQECLKRGQELIVQVIKEGIGTKGPTLTTYLSIPGRFLVLMPGMNRLGISRKIEDDEARNKLRDMLKQLEMPKDMGFIARTAGIDRNKRELQRDLNYLMRLWSNINAKIKSTPAPTSLYQESDLITRTLRDVYNSNITRVSCDSEATVKKVRDFLRVAMPRTRCNVQLYTEARPLFSKFGIEEEIERIQARYVALKNGGSLVIDSTEALVAIDVNSGKYRAHEDAESTAFKINQAAVPEIARQLRLRDLGGVIIIDFIDMMQEKHRRTIEKTLREAVAQDRARTKILRISQFGIVEMTRQRMRPSFTHSSYSQCPLCRGYGRVKTPESISIEVMRRLQSLMSRADISQIQVTLHPVAALFLQNQKRAVIADLEKSKGRAIIIDADPLLSHNEFRFSAKDPRGSVITLDG